jgi:hypothetical protein
MKMRLKAVALIIAVGLLLASLALGESRREISFPDILDYKTLKCDFHMHTVFSDGLVWPTVRIDEAWRDGLDAISITDHIEYHPHKADIPTNHNRPYELVETKAKEKNILLIKGAEITRETPPGHFNAIFVTDIPALDVEDFNDVVRIAYEQGGFVFWNHPGWKPEAKGWLDIHTKLYENKWLRGIEVVNGGTYYPEAQQWCLEKNLTMMGNSDIHNPITGFEDYDDPELTHRPVTLVFAKERTAESLKEALFAGRTAVWNKNQLIGTSKYLEALFNASVKIGKPYHKTKDTAWFEIKNISDIDMDMARAEKAGPLKILLPAKAVINLKLKVDDKKEEVKLAYTVKNFLIAPEKGLPVTLVLPLE